MLKKSVISLIIIFVSVYQLSGQIFVDNDYKMLDSVTYVDYINQDWEKVIYTGNIALNKNIDYFYLRMRMGIATYYLGRFPEAADHFENALIFNSKDQTAQLYLYDTYKLLGKNTKSTLLSEGHNHNRAQL